MSAVVSSLCMLFNFLSAIGIIFLNKVITDIYKFNFSSVITATHFLATWIGVRICQQCGVYQKKEISFWDVLPITVSFSTFVLCNNLSLQFNSVGFYQLMKVMTTPVVLILQYVRYDVKMPLPLQFSLLPVCIGVSLATVYDLSFNWVGFFWATAGLVATGFYQLLIKSQQSMLQADSFQLLHYQAPQSLTAMFITAPFTDDIVELASINFSAELIVLLGFTAVVAFCVNLSTYMVIEHTSPVSYQVLGHLKLIVILVCGIVLFNEDTNSVRLFGICLAAFGIILYSFLKTKYASGWENKDKATIVPEQKKQQFRDAQRSSVSN